MNRAEIAQSVKRLGSIPGRAKRFLSTPQHQNGLWGLLSLLYSGCGGKVAGAMKLTTHLHPVSRSRMVELYLYFPIPLHGAVLN
jgi:hypothetical protein